MGFLKIKVNFSVIKMKNDIYNLTENQITWVYIKLRDVGRKEKLNNGADILVDKMTTKNTTFKAL